MDRRQQQLLLLRQPRLPKNYLSWMTDDDGDQRKDRRLRLSSNVQHSTNRSSNDDLMYSNLWSRIGGDDDEQRPRHDVPPLHMVNMLPRRLLLQLPFDDDANRIDREADCRAVESRAAEIQKQLPLLLLRLLRRYSWLKRTVDCERTADEMQQLTTMCNKRFVEC